MNPKLHTLRVTPAIRRQRSALRALMDRFIAREATLATAPISLSANTASVVPFPEGAGKIIPFTLAPQAS
jgi:hypothetical protein